MGKFFVTIHNRSTNYRVCRDDINKVFSLKIRKMPKLPHYNHQKPTEDDILTVDQDSELQFEPIQFFPISSEQDNWTPKNFHNGPESF